MLDLTELEQFVSFAENGTLLKVSEIMNISQPTLTRNMRHIEEAFGVSLFTRGKNRLELNDTGWKAVEYAKQLLNEEKNAVQLVQEFDRKMRSITVASCAPAPLWTLLPKLSLQYPDNTISSRLYETGDIISDIEQEIIDIGILPYACTDEGLAVTPFLSEHLSVCIPYTHSLSSYEEITFKELNGYNCLLRDQIGFWTQLCRREMPASRFLIQTDESEFEELVCSSTLLCFTTDLVSDTGNLLQNRKVVPITDESANVTYHIVCKKERKHSIRRSPKAYCCECR